MSAFSSINVKGFYCHLLNISAYKRQLIHILPRDESLIPQNAQSYSSFRLAKIQVIGKRSSDFAYVNTLTVDTQC